MNQRLAFYDTVELARKRRMWMRSVEGGPTGELSYAHISDMYRRVTPLFSESKLGRWLGWAQAAVVASGVATLEEMKAINQKYADDDLSTDLEGAAEDPALGEAVQTPAQFAAFWNTKSEEQREEFLQGLKVDQEAASACFMEDHDGLQKQLDNSLAKQAELQGKLNSIQEELVAFGRRSGVIQPNAWITSQRHVECTECEALVEDAIDHCKETGQSSATFLSDGRVQGRDDHAGSAMVA